MPLVRVANTGISGVVDAHGRVIATLALGFEGALNVILPPPAAPTLFSRFGNLITGTLIWISFIFLLMSLKSEDFKTPTKSMLCGQHREIERSRIR